MFVFYEAGIVGRMHDGSAQKFKTFIPRTYASGTNTDLNLNEPNPNLKPES